MALVKGERGRSFFTTQFKLLTFYIFYLMFDYFKFILFVILYLSKINLTRFKLY